MHGGLITDLAVVTVVAALTGMLARRVGQPSILGYLLAGLIVGPYLPIPVFADPHRMEELAEVGVVLVMFAVGLEFRIRKFLDILPVSGVTALVQIAALSWAGYTIGSVMGWSTAASFSLGATLAISSTMVVSAVLGSRPVDPDVRSHVFGILVIQDVVAIGLMAVVTALAAGESVGVRSLGLLTGQLAAVVVIMLVVGLLVLPRLVRFALAEADTEVFVVLIAGAAFGLAWAADAFGYSVALGAFIAGMVVAESGRHHDIEQAVEPLRSLFSAIFFVSIGMSVDPAQAWRSLPLPLVLAGVVIGMQFLSVTVTTVLTGSSLRRAVYSGITLGQIGELSFVLATIAIAGGVMPQETLPVLVTVATITAFTTPLLLGRAQGILEAIDGWLPDRAQQVLTAYQSYLRASPRAANGPTLLRPALAVLLDWLALVILFVARYSLRGYIDPDFTLAANVATMVLGAPFIIGLVRSAVRLVGEVRRRREAQGRAPRTKAVESVALFTIVLAVGLPTVALVRPVLQVPWVEAALLGVVLAALVLLGLRLGRVPGDYTSGVARIALDIAGRMREPESGAEAAADIGPAVALDTGPLAGLDYLPIVVHPDSEANGRTLSDLEFRCRTGAAVVAILRGEETMPLPTGNDRIQAEDVLAVSGSPAALDRARTMLESVAADSLDVPIPESAALSAGASPA